eukprot:29080-Pelagococcus_subviridis.AAC.3
MDCTQEVEELEGHYPEEWNDANGNYIRNPNKPGGAEGTPVFEADELRCTGASGRRWGVAPAEAARVAVVAALVAFRSFVSFVRSLSIGRPRRFRGGSTSLVAVSSAPDSHEYVVARAGGSFSAPRDVARLSAASFALAAAAARCRLLPRSTSASRGVTLSAASPMSGQMSAPTAHTVAW